MVFRGYPASLRMCKERSLMYLEFLDTGVTKSPWITQSRRVSTRSSHPKYIVHPIVPCVHLKKCWLYMYSGMGPGYRGAQLWIEQPTIQGSVQIFQPLALPLLACDVAVGRRTWWHRQGLSRIIGKDGSNDNCVCHTHRPCLHATKQSRHHL